MWLGEQVTERGVGNGISIIIFSGIVAGLPHAIGATLELARTGEMNVMTILLLFAVAIAVTGFVVFVERGQRRITVNYAKRQQGRKVYAAQSTHLPLKLNMSGVIPPIFASSIILFPATMASWLGSHEGMGWLKDISTTLSPGQPLYVIFYSLAIVFFCFFYTALVFNARETADNLKKSGAFIPGIRPGEQTANYIDGVMTRLTTGRRRLHHPGLPDAGVPDSVLERTVLFRRYVAADYRCGGHGFYGPGTGASGVPPVRAA